MFKINDYVVYKKDVCIVKAIKLNQNDNDYYVLCPIDDDSLIINTPIENNCIRNIISKNEVESIIKKIPSIMPIDTQTDKIQEHAYRELLNNGTHEDLIRIIKTTYQRNKERIDNKKKISEKDDNFFNKAEHLLYNEFAIALKMSYDDAKEYVIKKVEENINEN